MRDEHWCQTDQINHLHYLQTKRWLQNLINEWQTENSSQSKFSPGLASLANILEKLERPVFQIAVFGMVGRGKSSVLNALVNRQLFETGALHGVTQSITSLELVPEGQVDSEANPNQAQAEELSSVEYSKILTVSNSQTDCLSQDSHQIPGQKFRCNWQGSIQVFDTPGIDEVDGFQQSAKAYRLANQVDLILFVIAGDLNQVEYDAIAELQKQGKPLLLVFNKIDLYPELDRLAIYRKICDCRVKQFISPSEIVMVAAAPVEIRGVVSEDGKIIRERSLMKPQIHQLEQKIGEIINHQGESLVALNNTVAAQKIHQQLLQLKVKQQELAIDELITKFVWLKALLIGLSPVAIADLLIGASLDLSLILALSALYRVSLSSSGAFPVLAVISLAIGTIGGVDLLVHLGLGYLFSTSAILESTQAYLPLSTYWLRGAAQGLVAGVSVIVLGQVAKQQFLQSLAWGNYQARKIIQTIIDSSRIEPLATKIKTKLG